jgi:hypothetical protein
LKEHVVETGIFSGVFLPVDVWGAWHGHIPEASTCHRLFMPNARR